MTNLLAILLVVGVWVGASLALGVLLVLGGLFHSLNERLDQMVRLMENEHVRKYGA